MKDMEEFRAKFETVKRRAFDIFFNNAPVDTGRLRSMIIMIDTPTGFVISNDVDYMQYVEDKTGWFARSMEETFNYIVREMTI